MSAVKEVFYYSLAYQERVQDEVEEQGWISRELARSMIETIHELEYELALYHAGCDSKQVQKIMDTTYERGFVE